MTIDLSSDRDAAALVDAIWDARRANRRDLLAQLLILITHESPTVREEAISLVFVKWRNFQNRSLLERVVRLDVDPGVRARALAALAATSDPATRKRDVALLRGFVLSMGEDQQVRKAAYEGLRLLLLGDASLIEDKIDLDDVVDLDWVRSL